MPHYSKQPTNTDQQMHKCTHPRVVRALTIVLMKQKQSFFVKHIQIPNDKKTNLVKLHLRKVTTEKSEQMSLLYV